MATGAGGLLHRIVTMSFEKLGLLDLVAVLAEHLHRLHKDIRLGGGVRIVTGPATLDDGAVGHLFGETLLLMAGETEVVPGLFQKPFLPRGVGIMAICAAHLDLRVILESGVGLRLLEALLLFGVAGIAQFRTFLDEDHSSHEAVPLMAGLAFPFPHRGMDHLLHNKGRLFLCVAVHAGLWSKAGRPLDFGRGTRGQQQKQSKERVARRS